MGLCGGQEHRQSCTRDQRGNPCRLCDVLADPESAQDQRKDQLGDEEGLDHRELTSVECDRLERKSPRRGGPAQQPEGLADQKATRAQFRCWPETPTLAVCCVMRCTALARAAAKAKTIVTVTS